MSIRPFRLLAVGVTTISLLVCGAEETKGVKVLYSFEPDEAKVRAYGKIVKGEASHGEHALMKDLRSGRVSRYCKNTPEPNAMKELPRLMAMPPSNDYHDVMQWYYERYCAIFDECGVSNRMTKSLRDWTPYERLRFDVLAKEAPVTLGISVRDGTGPRFRIGFTGVRSGNVLFSVPKGKWVSCDVPLKELARVSDVDLSKAQGFFLHINGFQGGTQFYIDHFRLVGPEGLKASKHELLAPIDGVKPRLYKVVKTPALPKIADRIRRDTSPVEKLGPVTVVEKGGFGRGGVTYCNTVRRGVVAYDNKRVAFLSIGGGSKASRKINPKSVGAGSIFAHASFDGGKSWGGIKPDEKHPTALNTWFPRAGASADHATGQIYMVGTENCQSYMGGYDTFFRSLGFDGEKWAPERVSMIDNNMQKCPWWSHVLRLPNGRLWACWCDGRVTRKGVGFPAKYSDDGGLTWFPCRNGDADEVPHPLHRPNLDDIEKAHEKAPGNVILLPAEFIPGPMMAPFRGSVASVSPNASRWSFHTEKGWDVTVRNASDYKKWKAIPAFGKSSGYSECTVTSVNDTDFFVCKGGRYRFNFWVKDVKRGRTTMEKLENAQLTDLAVAHYDGKKDQWSHEILETEGVWESILTASGANVFAFYVKFVRDGEKKSWEIRFRRWAAGKWGPSVLVATDTVRVNRLAAPRRCPTSYAAVLWDHIVAKGEPGPGGIKFARVPNGSAAP